MDDNQNIFNVVNPNTAYCKIGWYFAGHSRLLLQIDQDKSYQNTIYVIFTSVFYYSGPTSWVGCHFKIAGFKEAVEILPLAGLYESGKEFVEHHPLFLGGTSKINKVKIIASKHFEITDIPPSLP